MNRVRDMWNKPKGLTFVIELSVELPKSGERHNKPTESRNLMNPKQIIPKKIMLRNIIIKLLKTKVKKSSKQRKRYIT